MSTLFDPLKFAAPTAPLMRFCADRQHVPGVAISFFPGAEGRPCYPLFNAAK